jgi:uncharacterized protein YuzE
MHNGDPLPWRTTYDARANAAYIYLREPRDHTGHTTQVHESVLLDFHADGTLAGIEILGPHTQ